jgi:hypothetical protein
MANHPQETRALHVMGAISQSAAATGYVEVDYPTNAWAVLECLSAGGGTVSVAISTGTATGAAGSAVTTVTASSNNVCVPVHFQSKLSKYVYASGTGSAGAPSYSLAIVGQGYANSATVTTAGNPSEA